MHKADLKSALSNRNFEKAQVLIEEWGARVIQEMRNTTGEAALRRLMDNALDFASENAHLARVVRAHIGAELHSNSAAFLYLDPESEQHYWHLQA